MASPGRSGHVDWQHWVARFDRMQERYLPRRNERFEVMTSTVRALAPEPRCIVDLGCGAGSLTGVILQAFAGCRVVGIDLDSSLLALAKARLARFNRKVTLVRRDLRDEAWCAAVGGQADAVVSATAMHWLSPAHLALLYRRIATALRPGGIFLNADHVGSDVSTLQKAWEEHKATTLRTEHRDRADSWGEFFVAYAEALGVDPKTVGDGAVGPWEGVEQGMPLAWHFDRLRECGFISPDCFWRCDGDAVYGALKGGPT